MKKAFGLVEILFSLLIISMVSGYAVYKYTNEETISDLSLVNDAQLAINEQLKTYQDINCYMSFNFNEINSGENGVFEDDLGNKFNYVLSKGNKLSLKNIECEDKRIGFVLNVFNDKSDYEVQFNSCIEKTIRKVNSENKGTYVNGYTEKNTCSANSTSSNNVVPDNSESTPTTVNNVCTDMPLISSGLTFTDIQSMYSEYPTMNQSLMNYLNSEIAKQNATTLSEIEQIMVQVYYYCTATINNVCTDIPTVPGGLILSDFQTLGIIGMDSFSEELINYTNKMLKDKKITTVSGIQNEVNRIATECSVAPTTPTEPTTPTTPTEPTTPTTPTEPTTPTTPTEPTTPTTPTEPTPSTPIAGGLSNLPVVNYINSFAPDAGCPEIPQPFVMSDATTISSIDQPFFLGSGFIVDSNLYKSPYSASTSNYTLGNPGPTVGFATTTAIYEYWARNLQSSSAQGYYTYPAVPTVSKLPNATFAPNGNLIFNGPFVNLELGNPVGGTNIKVSFPNDTDTCINYNHNLMRNITFNGGDHVLHVGRIADNSLPKRISVDLNMGNDIDMVTAYFLGDNSMSRNPISINLGDGNNLLKAIRVEQNVTINGGDNDDQIEINYNKGEQTNTYKNKYNLGNGNNNLFIEEIDYQIDYIYGGTGRDIVKLSDSTSIYVNNIDLGAGDDILEITGPVSLQNQGNVYGDPFATKVWQWNGGDGNDTLYLKDIPLNEWKNWYNNIYIDNKKFIIGFENIVLQGGIVVKGTASQEMFYWNNISF